MESYNDNLRDLGRRVLSHDAGSCESESGNDEFGEHGGRWLEYEDGSGSWMEAVVRV